MATDTHFVDTKRLKLLFEIPRARTLASVRTFPSVNKPFLLVIYQFSVAVCWVCKYVGWYQGHAVRNIESRRRQDKMKCARGNLFSASVPNKQSAMRNKDVLRSEESSADVEGLFRLGKIGTGGCVMEWEGPGREEGWNYDLQQNRNSLLRKIGGGVSRFGGRVGFWLAQIRWACLFEVLLRTVPALSTYVPRHLIRDVQPRYE